jgi:hypothetical protein
MSPVNATIPDSGPFKITLSQKSRLLVDSTPQPEAQYLHYAGLGYGSKPSKYFTAVMSGDWVRKPSLRRNNRRTGRHVPWLD